VRHAKDFGEAKKQAGWHLSYDPLFTKTVSVAN
jgi:hypothetical protein